MNYSIDEQELLIENFGNIIAFDTNQEEIKLRLLSVAAVKGVNPILDPNPNVYVDNFGFGDPRTNVEILEDRIAEFEYNISDTIAIFQPFYNYVKE